MKSKKTNIVAVIAGENVQIMQQQIERVKHDVDIVELRLDRLIQLDIKSCQQLIQRSPLPTLLTLRNKSHGGTFAGSVNEKIRILSELMITNPSYVDLENGIPIGEIQKLKQLNPHVKIICSYHNFKNTPEHLSSVLNSMQDSIYDIYKIVTMANTSLDSMRLLDFVKQHGRQINLVAHCMGECGQFSRVLSPAMGSRLCYVTPTHDHLALGLLTLEEATTIYPVSQLNEATKLYALLGDPVMTSLGHVFHNQYIRNHNYNAVYVKIKLTKNELIDFFAYATRCNFQGFSVTMPLKQAVIPHLQIIDKVAEEMQAVNTLTYDDQQQLHGFNTDGLGAIIALKEHTTLKGKRVLVLGAGGSARAIAYLLVQKDANVTVLNRTTAKAVDYTARIGCRGGGLDRLNSLEAFDIIVNTIPVLEDLLQQSLKNVLQHKPLAMDIIYQAGRTTPFTTLAKAYDSQVIPGQIMFEYQALKQWKYWLN